MALALVLPFWASTPATQGSPRPSRTLNHAKTKPTAGPMRFLRRLPPRPAVRPSPEPSLPEGTGKHTVDGLGKYNVSSNHSEKEGPGHRAPWSPDWYPDGELIELCREGLVNEYVDIQGDGGDSDVCCPPKCGMCGGPMCRERPGAATSCCVEDIERSHVYCEVESDIQCIMPLTCTEDPCMVHCPLNPGCSVIWKNRGR